MEHEQNEQKVRKKKIKQLKDKKINVAVVAFWCFHLHEKKKIRICWNQMYVLFEICAYLWMTPYSLHSFGSLMWIHQYFTECTCFQGHLWNKSNFFFGTDLHVYWLNMSKHYKKNICALNRRLSHCLIIDESIQLQILYVSVELNHCVTE